MAVDAYGRTMKRGVVLNYRTLEMLEITELRSLDRLGIVPLGLSQGSYTSSNPQSGGTHDGGGVFDVRVLAYGPSTRESIVWALRKTGFAAWLRNPSQGDWPYHIHAVAIGDKELSPAAKQQVVWYKQGLNGLWGSQQGPDDGPKVDWTEYRQDIDLSYYGPERWDDADFDRFERKVGWKRDVSNFNTDPATTIDAMVSLSYAHQHATDADEKATAAVAGVAAVSGKADQTLAKLDEILGKLPPPA